MRTADAIYGESDMSGRVYDASPVRDTPANRLKGWQRVVLLVSFFGPSDLYEPERSFSLYAGRPFVFPVVRRRSRWPECRHCCFSASTLAGRLFCLLCAPPLRGRRDCRCRYSS